MPTSVSRAALLQTGAAAGALALLPRYAVAQSGALTTLKLGATPSDDMTPIVYGTKTGIFTRAGLELNVTRMSNGPSVMAGVVSGAFDIGKTSIATVFDAHEKGLPFTIVAIAIVYDSKAPYAAYLVPKDSPIQSGKDFNNQLVSTGAIGGIGQIGFFSWVEQHGGDPKSVKFVEIPYTAAVAAVEAGRVAAAEVSLPALAVGLEKGMRSVPVFDSLGPQYAFVVWVTTKEFSAAHPQAIRAFYRAYVEAATYTNAHHAETAPLMAEFTGIPLATIQHMTRGIAGTSILASQIQPVIDTCFKYGSLKRSFPAQELIDVNAR